MALSENSEAAPVRVCRSVAIANPAQHLVIRLCDEKAQVIDGRSMVVKRGVRRLAMGVPADDEQDALADESTFPEHVHAAKALRSEA